MLGLWQRSLLCLLLLLHLLLLLLPLPPSQLFPTSVNTGQFTLHHVISLSKVLDLLPQQINPLIRMRTFIYGFGFMLFCYFFLKRYNVPYLSSPGNCTVKVCSGASCFLTKPSKERYRNYLHRCLIL